MKLVSDFDGVWTDPAAEAAAQGDLLERRLAEWSPPSARDAIAGWLARARAAVVAEPTRYGWEHEGRLSAFGDEDPFTAHSALLHYVQVAAATDPVAAALRDAVAAHGLSLERFGSQCHAEGVARVVAARGPGILPAAAAAGRALLERDVEIAVVSNSGLDKLGAWFGHAGLPNAPHPMRAARTLRLRGDSRKFALDPTRRQPLVLGDTQIETARPDYERVLREERPGAIVGDVLSLDLALPLFLKRRDPDWRDVRLLWLKQPYTPAWLRDRVERHAAGEVELVDDGLAGIARTLAGR